MMQRICNQPRLNLSRRTLFHHPRITTYLSFRIPGTGKPASCTRLAGSKQVRRLSLRAHKEVETVKETQEEPSIYYEPFLRSFVLGLSAGAVFETLHVASKFLNLLGEVGTGGLAHTLPSVSEQFAPLFVDDHIVAVGCWLLFYAIEVVAILKVLDQHSQNPEAAAHALRTLTTLPKMMLPRLRVLKHLLRKFGFGVQPLAVTAAVGSGLVTPRLSGPIRNSIVTFPPRPKVEPPISDPQQEPEGPEDEEDDDKDKEQEKERQPQSVSDTPLQRRRAELGLRPGQLETSAAELLHRAKELSGRRSYLTNFWYAVGISDQVKEKPVGVEILGEKVVLYRDGKGVVHCLHDVCPHRGAPLHLGWKAEVNGHDCIVCPYHGWAFDEGGHLRDVPAAENSNEWPKKPLVDSFPVEEKGGFIWLFYGSKSLPKDERPPIPYVPELDNPAWKPVYGEIEFECNHWSVFENAIDMAHIHYLHSDSFGNDSMPQIRDMTCTSNAYGVDAHFGLHNKPVNAMWEFSKVPQVKVSAKALLPSTSVIGFTLAKGLSFVTFVNTVPISANRTVNRFALIRRLDVDRVGSFVFNMDAWDSAARSAMIKILTQDKAMVEQLAPEMLGREISVKADLPQMAFRKIRQQYIDMGYGVSLERAIPERAEEHRDM